jgi:hypothetical protein
MQVSSYHGIPLVEGPPTGLEEETGVGIGGQRDTSFRGTERLRTVV